MSPRALAFVVLAAGCQRATAADSRAPRADEAGNARATPAVSAAPAGPDAEAPVSSALLMGTDAAARPLPFGPATPIARYTCPAIQRGGAFRSFLAGDDTRVAFVDGNDPTAIVNRSPTGALAPNYVPDDLVDIKDGRHRKPSECGSAHECMREAAAAALRRMLDAMRAEGIEGRIQSAFRAFATQCWVFANWAHQARGGFCEATEQSALPGHSQHQLGTTVDLFTREWADEGARRGQGVFRNGFGCTRGGVWLDENAWRYGFLVSYPIHPDDRLHGSRCLARADRSVPVNPKTGYKHEPWHLRFIGEDAGARYHAAWLASGPGTPGEITLEQWLRAGRGLVGDAELPACDGCQCGACATLAGDDWRTPCGKASLHLGADGRVVAPADPPHLAGAHVSPAPGGAVDVEAIVVSPAHTPTQPPLFGADAPGYPDGATYLAVAANAGVAPRAYPDLPGAWRIAIAPDPAGPTAWPWRASLAAPDLAATWNRANVVLPAKPGELHVHVRVTPPPSARALSVALSLDGAAHDVLTLPIH
ncbi:MAG: M15 family metallopeptidase [Polyangiaceae bacterium]|nr:M15 family metallopeptidase [Polyangiaceae bacterium]